MCVRACARARLALSRQGAGLLLIGSVAELHVRLDVMVTSAALAEDTQVERV